MVEAAVVSVTLPGVAALHILTELPPPAAYPPSFRDLQGGEEDGKEDGEAEGREVRGRSILQEQQQAGQDQAPIRRFILLGVLRQICQRR